ncbi:MAG TPA: hypothetical protein VGM91_00865 [Conexibacter sp.]|jgi:hypothetical protein
MTRDEARAEIAQVLIEKVREDRYPSATHMSMLEEVLTPEMVSDYVDVLLDKIAADRWPSIPMIQRVQRLSASLPIVEQPDQRELEEGEEG